MDTCICGRPIEDRGTSCSRCAALHEIGLEAGATEADIKAAYRAHVKAWHPDRYADDKRQQRAAELKLKKVNAAYDLLSAPEPEPIPAATPRPDPMAARWQEEVTEDRPAAASYPAWEQYSEPTPAPTPIPDFAYSTWAHSRPRPPAPYVDTTADEDLPALGDLPAPDDLDQSSSSRDSGSHGLRTSIIYGSLVVAVVLGTYFLNSTQVKPHFAHHSASAAVAAPAANPAPAAPQGQYTAPVVPEFFTLGSLKSDVVAVQGNPSSIEDNKYLYGLSTVNFENDKVVGWNVNPLNPLKVILAPKSQPPAKADYFTLGSSMDDVIAIEGTPTAVWPNTLEYGGSSVRFDDGKVTGWTMVPANPIKVKLVPSSHTDVSRGYFTSGSTRDEVVAIQGTPTSIWEDTWQYGKSSITFEDNKVVRWSVFPADPLRVRAPR